MLTNRKLKLLTVMVTIITMAVYTFCPSGWVFVIYTPCLAFLLIEMVLNNRKVKKENETIA